MYIQEITARGLRFSIKNDTEEVGHAYLYILQNDLHKEPFGLLEDVFVREDQRSSGIARKLLERILEYARTEGCYKLIATSRNDKTRDSVHNWYIRLGFRDYGTEFRLDYS